MEQNKNVQYCPECSGKNSPHAVRCIHEPDGVNRCEYYFKSRECRSCNTHNAPSAETCRNCNTLLIDPSDKLNHKAYTADQFKKVIDMTFSVAKNGTLWVRWDLDSVRIVDGKKEPEVGYQMFIIGSENRNAIQLWKNFVYDHVTHWGTRTSLMKCKSAEDVMKMINVFEVPTEITHRINDKNKSVVVRKHFANGRKNYE